MELGSISWVACLAAELFFNSCFSDTVLVTLLRTAVETAISGVRKLIRSGGVPTSLTSKIINTNCVSVVVLAVADGPFGLCGSERGGAIHLYPTPSPFPFPNKPYGLCGRKAP